MSEKRFYHQSRLKKSYGRLLKSKYFIKKKETISSVGKFANNMKRCLRRYKKVAKSCSLGSIETSRKWAIDMGMDE